MAQSSVCGSRSASGAGETAGRGALVSFAHAHAPGPSRVDGVPGRLRVGAWWAPRDGITGGGRSGGTAGGPGFGLGLDLERTDAPAFAGPQDLGPVAFSLPERMWIAGRAPGARPAARARLWTRKEALVKAAGTGFRDDPARVPALRPGPGARLLDLPAGVVGPGTVGALALVRRPTPGPWAALA